MSDRPPLTELQIAILSVLWDRGEATSAEVRSALEPGRCLALTTVTTLLGRLERKEVVAHEREGRRYLYRATVTRDSVQREMVSDLTDVLFDGDPARLVGHVLETGDLGTEGIERLRLLLDEHRERSLDGEGRRA
ncbi:MAG: BlaI/MecI/CopY family transcriptional regulator [Gemmatimonadota bacterium]